MVEVLSFQLQNHSERAANDEDVLACFLKIDGYIDQISVQIMKLSMRLELSQTEIDNANHPSDLYHALANHYSGPGVALARFIYALKILGHRRYGCRAIRELELLEQKLEPFDPSSSIVKQGADLNDFCLHQCLALACQVLPKESYESFIVHFPHILNINPKTVNTPCEIVTQLIEKDKISAENHLDMMEEALIKSRLSDHEIREYVEDCYMINSYESIRSRTSSCTTVECDNGSRTMNIQDLAKKYVQAGITRNMMRLGLWYVMLFLLSIPLYGAFLSVITSDSTSLIHCQSNSTVIIANSSALKVIQDARHPEDYEHNITVYQVNIECGKLPAKRTLKFQTGKDFSLVNSTTIYALGGSSITLNVCGSTNSTKILRRLGVTVIKGLEDDFDFNFFIPGEGGTWKCREVIFNITHFGYYTLVFQPQPENTLFNFSVIFNYNYLDLSLLTWTATKTLFKDKDEWELPQGGWFDRNRCFVATIGYNPHAPLNNVHIRGIYKTGTLYFLGQHLVVIGSVVGFTCIFFVALRYIIKLKKKIWHNIIAKL